MNWKIKLSLVIFVALTGCGFHRSPVSRLPNSEKQGAKTLFIAFDGIGYDLISELKEEGHFKNFSKTAPLVVTFPSGTTIGFTGIFQPLQVGDVPGYEVRFYSFKENKVIGGTPLDFYKIPIKYKTYFDAFRHTMFEKAVMYVSPGVAGKEDLLRTEKLLLNSEKDILITYLGGTDGAQHLLGRKRTKRFMIFADRMIERMKKRYFEKHSKPLRVVLFSDHGFHYSRLKMVWSNQIVKALKKGGVRITGSLNDPRDVVLVRYGLLSSGVMITSPQMKETAARLINKVQGIDLVFWPEGNKIHILNSLSEEAYFEYRAKKAYRYVTVRGDPLGYQELLRKNGYRGGFLQDAQWKRFVLDHNYPDAGYRLYDSFHHLVFNKASILFSLKPAYQFGGLAALIGTKLKWGGHKGTHGGLFRSDSYGMVMVDDPNLKLPPAVRYDDFFKIFLPRVSKLHERRYGKKEVPFYIVSR